MGGPPASGLGEVVTTPQRKKHIMLRNIKWCLGPGEKNEMGGVCRTYGAEERRIQGFDGET